MPDPIAPLSPWPQMQATMRDSIIFYMQEHGMAKGMAEQFFPVLAESIAYGILNNLPQMFLTAHDPTVANHLTPDLLGDDVGD